MKNPDEPFSYYIKLVLYIYFFFFKKSNTLVDSIVQLLYRGDFIMLVPGSLI
jgi:hypothetical protein